MKNSPNYLPLTLAVLLAAFGLSASPTQGEGTTALCKVQESPCSPENLVNTLHLVKSGTPAIKILTWPSTVLCLEALAIANVSEPAEPQQIEVTEFQFKGCGTSRASPSAYHQGITVPSKSKD